MNFLILKDGFIINFDKSKELVLHRPHVTRHYLPQSLVGIEQVLSVRLLGVIFQSSLSFAAHVDYVLKVCSQRIFLLKQLRAQAMPLEQLYTVFQGIILQCLAYALPAWFPFLSVVNLSLTIASREKKVLFTTIITLFCKTIIRNNTAHHEETRELPGERDNARNNAKNIRR